jgi:hypothetical protein
MMSYIFVSLGLVLVVVEVQGIRSRRYAMSALTLVFAAGFMVIAYWAAQQISPDRSDTSVPTIQTDATSPEATD